MLRIPNVRRLSFSSTDRSWDPEFRRDLSIIWVCLKLSTDQLCGPFLSLSQAAGTGTVSTRDGTVEKAPL
ncbi:unnamed protein product [Calypogeia fissa]